VTLALRPGTRTTWRVVPPAGARLSVIDVLLVPASDLERSGGTWELQSAADARGLHKALQDVVDRPQTFDGVPPGEFVLVARADGLTEARLDVTVPEGGLREPIVLRLVRGLGIRGTLVLEGGDRPRGHVEVTAVPIEGDDTRSALPDERGAFILDGLEAVPYRLEDFGQRVAHVVVPEVSPGGEPLWLRLVPAALVRLRFRRPAGARPVGMVRTEFEPAEVAMDPSHDYGGGDWIELRGVDLRVRRLVVSARGFRPTAVDLPVLSSETDPEVEVALEPVPASERGAAEGD
jgi:hypothetical protein